MKKLVILLLVVGAFYFLLKERMFSQAKDVPFTGTWVLVESNEVNGAKVTRKAAVSSDKKRFLIAARVTAETYGQPPSEHDTVTVFDGETLHEKTRYPGSPPDLAAGTEAFDESDEEDGDAPAQGEGDPAMTSEKPTENQLNGLRFWARAYQGDAGPGGRVCGRETKLYQKRVNRPDAEETVQAWVDAETGLVLKSNISLFSRQINQLMMKITEECQDIKYGPVDPAQFAKP